VRGERRGVRRVWGEVWWVRDECYGVWVVGSGWWGLGFRVWVWEFGVCHVLLRAPCFGVGALGLRAFS